MKIESLPLTTEYGSTLHDAYASPRETLETKTRAMMGGKLRPVVLYFQPAGYVPAGSCARLQRCDVWGYSWSDGRATHGRMFSTLAEAKTYFDAIA